MYSCEAWPRRKGQMLGVLLAKDAEGETHTLRAFSGQFQKVWLCPGWAPPLAQMRHDTEGA